MAIGGASATRQMGLGRDQCSSSPLNNNHLNHNQNHSHNQSSSPSPLNPHSSHPSALIHHPPKPYPSPSHPLGLGGSVQQQQQQQQQQPQQQQQQSVYVASVGHRASYSAKVLAFQQPQASALGPSRNLPAIGGGVGMGGGSSSASSQLSPSPVSCIHPSSEDAAASFFNFDSLSSTAHLTPHPTSGLPLPPTELLQPAGKQQVDHLTHPHKPLVDTLPLARASACSLLRMCIRLSVSTNEFWCRLLLTLSLRSCLTCRGLVSPNGPPSPRSVIHGPLRSPPKSLTGRIMIFLFVFLVPTRIGFRRTQYSRRNARHDTRRP